MDPMDSASLSPRSCCPELSEENRTLLLHLLQRAITAKPTATTPKHNFSKMFGKEEKKASTSLEACENDVSLPLDIPHLPFDARCENFGDDDQHALREDINPEVREEEQGEEEIGTVGDLDDEERKIQHEHWNWGELNFSSNYNMFLLRWETDLQVELGKSILSLLKSLRDAIAQVILVSFFV